MRKERNLTRHIVVISFIIGITMAAGALWADPVIIDHNCTDITLIPESAINQAKANLHIAYGHTSHGSQLTTGMTGLVGFANGGGLGLSLPNDIFAWNNGGSGGALDLEEGDGYGTGWLDHDCGYYPNWVNETREYLNDTSHADVNVIIWSWCGQASGYTEQQMTDNYLTPMTQLEQDYPNVTFVYMTGHLDGGGDTGNLHLRNEQIRAYCRANDKVLYDFADIESYDPDGLVNYMVLLGEDTCEYDSNGDGSQDTNWATSWQNSHTQDYHWYSCGSSHTQPLNANLKAYAAWWLWSVLGGWNPAGVNRSPVLQPIGNQSVPYGQLLLLNIFANDLDSGDVLTYSTGTLPGGALFDSSAHTFRWTPGISDLGDHLVTFTVIDDGSPQGSDEESITISVTEPGANTSDTEDGSSSSCFMSTIWK